MPRLGPSAQLSQAAALSAAPVASRRIGPDVIRTCRKEAAKMTTPNLPAPPAIDSGSFQGVLCPPQVQQQIISLIIDQANFAASLTRIVTRAGQVAFPVAAPSGAAWLNELDQLPTMNLNDDAHVVGLAKLAGLVDVSNESVSDSQINLTAQITLILRDSLSKQLDEGILNGSGPPEPVGVIGAAPVADGPDLLAAVLAGRGSIADAGGTPNILAMSGTALAAADGERDLNGQLVFPNGFAAAAGLTPVTVPNLATPLVYDSTRLYCVVNGDLSTVEWSNQFRWDYDAVSFRVKSRITAACPAPDKSLRKITITPPAPLAAKK
jgi:HK97 family phage major capsid protein